ncbi:MAG: glycosyl hydrolase family 18 protein [Cyclobacteriaceae bacterium]
MNRIKKSLSSNKRTVDSSLDTTDIITWTMKPYIPNSGMIHDYQHIFTFLHSEQECAFDLTDDLKSIEWDSIQNVFYKNTGGVDKLAEDVEVIGWYPHWMGDSYKQYNYRLLSMVSFYSFEINPDTGSSLYPEIIDQLKKTSLPDSAAKYGTKALISVTSLEKENNRSFLNSQFAQDQFIFEIIDLLEEERGRYSGIDLNFEEVDPANRDDFTYFVKKLGARLRSEDYILLLDVPFFNDGQAFDYAELKNHVKYFNIMGYGFNNSSSTYPGSISPLRSLDNQPSLEKTVNDFLNLDIPGEQIILSLPLYGITWNIDNLANGNAAEYETSLPFYRIMSNYAPYHNPYYDPFSSSFFFVFEEDGTKKMCWYENDISLDAKFKWINEKKLKGLGLWALGYAKGDPKIWGAVMGNFGADSLVAITPVSSKFNGTYGIAKNIVDHKKTIGMALLIFSGFLFAGFVLSLADWKVRQILFQNQSFRVVYSLAFITLTTVGIEWYWPNDIVLNMTIGITIGAIGVLMINLVFSKYRKQLK